MKWIATHPTPEGTGRFAARFAADTAPGFYRQAQDLLISSIGIGSYLGAMDSDTDAAYTLAVQAALAAGVNFIDTSLNYRHQRSERAIAAGIRAFIDSSGGSRDQIVVCTKGGYLVPGAMPERALDPRDVVGGVHSMAPAFIADQLERSSGNLDLQTIDVYYLHNPETQLEFVDFPEFMNRIRAAFERLERAVSDGLIRYYGTATWNGYRSGSTRRALSLPAIAEAARQVAGDKHHFRFIQLPFNLAMPEALMRPVEGSATILKLAEQLDITVVASASLLQSKLSRNLPGEVARLLPGLVTDAQRAIQFARSTPGIASALVGMSSLAHVRENLTVAKVPPLTAAEFEHFCTAVLQAREC